MLAHRCKANRHVTAVSTECRRDVVTARGRAPQKGAAFRRGKPGAADTVGDHQAGCDDDAAVFHHVVLDRCKVSGIRQEIVIEENHDIRVGRRRSHGVALARQPGFVQQDPDPGGGISGPLDIGRLRSANNDLVRRTGLAAKLTQGVPEDGGSSNGRNTNRDPAAHVRISHSGKCQPSHSTNNLRTSKRRRRPNMTIRRPMFVEIGSVEVLIGSFVCIGTR
jgi:hypothetical protein